jgi:hypothetical protein
MRLGPLIVLATACGAYGQVPLTPSARALKISSAEPPEKCVLIGGFSTSDDCLGGTGEGNADQDAQFDCIRWKADSMGGNRAVLDATVQGGYYRGRVYKCP